MRIAKSLLDQLVGHARDEAPNESCGIVGTVEGQPKTFYPARNWFESPLKFEIHTADMIEIFNETERRGEEMGILFHSHPKTEARPSQTDINEAARITLMIGELTWFIASLVGSSPVVRAFRISDGEVEEVELLVE